MVDFLWIHHDRDGGGGGGAAGQARFFIGYSKSPHTKKPLFKPYCKIIRNIET